MIGYDPGSPVPPYEQVRAQLARQVQAGELVPGTRLPTVRRLAGDLGLAVNTVARAYRELERDGLVVTRGRNGTVVAASPDESVALDAAADYAARVRGLGLSTERALELVRGVLEASDPGPPRPAAG
jgi:DNA-binding transcriptional regulator YhcF (GntR family)